MRSTKQASVESWGRGFKKIAEESNSAGMPMPAIEENGGGVMYYNTNTPPAKNDEAKRLRQSTYVFLRYNLFS